MHPKIRLQNIQLETEQREAWLRYLRDIDADVLHDSLLGIQVRSDHSQGELEGKVIDDLIEVEETLVVLDKLQGCLAESLGGWRGKVFDPTGFDIVVQSVAVDLGNSQGRTKEIGPTVRDGQGVWGVGVVWRRDASQTEVDEPQLTRSWRDDQVEIVGRDHIEMVGRGHEGRGICD